LKKKNETLVNEINNRVFSQIFLFEFRFQQDLLFQIDQEIQLESGSESKKIEDLKNDKKS
jgi:hypothetical protein